MKNFDVSPEPIWSNGGEHDKKSSSSILIGMLNWYSANRTTEQAKKYLIDYLVKTKKSENKLVNFINSYPDRSFVPTRAFLSRIVLKAKGEVPQFFIEEINTFIDKLKEELRNKSPNNTKKEKTPVLDNSPQASEIIEKFFENINHFSDDKMSSTQFSCFDWCKYLQVINASKSTILKFIEKSKKEISFLSQSLEDEFLNEAYSHLTRKKRKTIIDSFNSQLEKLEGLLKETSKNKTIKTRKKRKVSPAILVKKLKYRDSLKEKGLSVISILPTSIIGSNFLICFNTKNYSIQVYQAKAGETLSVKGTTLCNFCTNLSYSKTLRKNKLDIIEKLSKSGKECFDLVDSINSKKKPLSGRINSDCLLLTCG